MSSDVFSFLSVRSLYRYLLHDYRNIDSEDDFHIGGQNVYQNQNSPHVYINQDDQLTRNNDSPGLRLFAVLNMI